MIINLMMAAIKIWQKVIGVETMNHLDNSESQIKAKLN